MIKALWAWTKRMVGMGDDAPTNQNPIKAHAASLEGSGGSPTRSPEARGIRRPVILGCRGERIGRTRSGLR